MAYFTPSAPANLAAHVAHAAGLVLRPFVAAFEFLGRMNALNTTVHARLATAERLQAKSDAELAQLGLKRDEIARVVFRDLLWT